jgi:hypothetical protein
MPGLRHCMPCVAYLIVNDLIQTQDMPQQTQPHGYGLVWLAISVPRRCITQLPSSPTLTFAGSCTPGSTGSS